MRAPALAVASLFIACADSSTPPATTATAAVSLDVPPLPPPKPTAEEPAVLPIDPDDESPLPRDPTAAEAAYQGGHRAMAGGDIARARALFLKSYRLEQTHGALVNLAICEEKLGRRDDALRHYQAAYNASLNDGRKERASAIKSRLDALKNQP